MPKEHWKATLDEHDYPAARAYLSLLVTPKTAKALTKSLQDAPLNYAKAKDLLRASQLGLLPADDAYVRADLRKVHDGTKLSPVLLVRGVLGAWPLIVADGYHRICASYHISDDADVPRRTADMPSL
jgi:hypothetical protein